MHSDRNTLTEGSIWKKILLFALPILNGDSVINITTELESAAYIDITIECLKLFGVEIVKGQNNN